MITAALGDALKAQVFSRMAVAFQANLLIFRYSRFKIRFTCYFQASFGPHAEAFAADVLITPTHKANYQVRSSKFKKLNDTIESALRFKLKQLDKSCFFIIYILIFHPVIVYFLSTKFVIPFYLSFRRGISLYSASRLYSIECEFVIRCYLCSDAGGISGYRRSRSIFHSRKFGRCIPGCSFVKMLRSSARQNSV
jgi:hypothetical protein